MQVPLVRNINIAVKGPFLVRNLHQDCYGSVDKAPALFVGSDFCAGNVSENQLILLMFLALNSAPAQCCNFINLHLIISLFH